MYIYMYMNIKSKYPVDRSHFLKLFLSCDTYQNLKKIINYMDNFKMCIRLQGQRIEAVMISVDTLLMPPCGHNRNYIIETSQIEWLVLYIGICLFVYIRMVYLIHGDKTVSYVFFQFTCHIFGLSIT